MNFINTLDKPYICGVCGKYFGQASYLMNQKFIDTEEKTFMVNVSIYQLI